MQSLSRPAASPPLRASRALLERANAFVRHHIRSLELIGAVMRIFSFSLVSWLGAASPFMFVWVFNTADAILLTWCAILKRDSA